MSDSLDSRSGCASRWFGRPVQGFGGRGDGLVPQAVAQILPALRKIERGLQDGGDR